MILPCYESAWVGASAGTGKTYLLTTRVLQLLLNGIPPSKILCLTFTKAAASEMLFRINNIIKLWAQYKHGINNDTNHAIHISIHNVTQSEPTSQQIITASQLFRHYNSTGQEVKAYTIHAFCQNLLTKFPIEAGLSTNFEIIDDITSQNIINNIIETNSIFLHYAMDLLQHVSWFKLRDILYEGIAKMRSIDSNLKDIHQVLHIAPNETVEQVTQNFITQISQIDISHYAALHTKIADIHNAIQKLHLIHNIKDFGYNFADSDICQLFLTSTLTPRKTLVPKSALNGAAQLEIALNKMQDITVQTNNKISDIITVERSQALNNAVKILLFEYQKYKTQHNYLDYDDLITNTYHLLCKADVKDWVSYKLDGGIQHLLLDEAQDTSRLQWQIIFKLVEDFFVEEYQHDIEKERTIFVVGDVKQSIYGFQGAAPELFNTMHDKIKQQAINSHRTFHSLELTKTYRMPENILQFVNDKFSHIRNFQYPSNMTCSRVDDKGIVEYITYDTSTDAINTNIAHEIAKYINKHIDQQTYIHSMQRTVRYEDFLILIRKRGELLESMATNFAEYCIPHAGVDRISLESNEAVLSLLSAAKFCFDSKDRFNLVRLLKSRICNVTEDALYDIFTATHLHQAIPKYLQEQLEYIKYLGQTVSASQFFQSIIYDYGIIEQLQCDNMTEEVDAIQEFLKIAHTLTYQEMHSLSQVVQYFENNHVQIKRDLSSSNFVRMMTVHNAKGLESPIVIIADDIHARTQSDSILFCEECGMLMPRQYSQNTHIQNLKDIRDKNKQEENNRLLYVALTRAKDILAIVSARSLSDAAVQLKDYCEAMPY